MILKILTILIITISFIIFTKSFIINESFSDSLQLRFPFPSFIINLLETEEGRRRWPIISHLYPEAEKHRAIYGKEYDFSHAIKNNVLTDTWDHGKWKYNKSNIIKMTPGEMGVIMSHYKLWKRIAVSETPVVILEDDAIRTNKYSQERLDYVLKNLPKDYDIYLIGYYDIKPEKDGETNTRVKEFVLMHSYIVSPKGAQKLLDNLPVNQPLDTWISGLSNKLKIYRHNFYMTTKKGHVGLIIRQKNQEKQIENTNII